MLRWFHGKISKQEAYNLLMTGTCVSDWKTVLVKWHSGPICIKLRENFLLCVNIHMSVLVWLAPVVVTLVEYYTGGELSCLWVLSMFSSIVNVIIFDWNNFLINTCVINYFTYWWLHQMLWRICFYIPKGKYITKSFSPFIEQIFL